MSIKNINDNKLFAFLIKPILIGIFTGALVFIFKYCTYQSSPDYSTRVDNFKAISEINNLFLSFI